MTISISRPTGQLRCDMWLYANHGDSDDRQSHSLHFSMITMTVQLLSRILV